VKHGWSIREYREGDEKGILELTEAVHGAVRDKEQWMRRWHWMYKHNPTGAGRIWLAEHNDKIVGQYPLILMNLKVGDDIVQVSQNVDVMTHPDYRYQGMFSMLERRALDELEKAGVHITIGFPNDAAYPGHMKSGWFDIGVMQVLCKVFNWRNAIKLKVDSEPLQRVLAIGASVVFNKIFFRAQKRRAIVGLTINQITSFDERFDEFWTKICNQSQIMVVRNKDHLNWRYGAPDIDYSIFIAEKDGEICGYLVLGDRIQKDVKVRYIFDTLAQSEELIRCLVSRATADCCQSKVDLIIYLFIASRTYSQVLKRNGFIPIPFIEGGHFGAYSSSKYISKEFLSKPENWFVQVGDSDMP